MNRNLKISKNVHIIEAAAAAAAAVIQNQGPQEERSKQCSRQGGGRGAGRDADVKVRLGKAGAPFHQLRNIWGAADLILT